MDVQMAAKFVRATIHIFGDVPPSVPPKGVSLVSVFASKKHNTKREHQRYVWQTVRLASRYP